MRVVHELERPGAVVVAAHEGEDVAESIRRRLLRDDGARAASFRTAAGRARFELSRAAAYAALARIGHADARLAPSGAGRPPRVAYPCDLWLSVSHTVGMVVAAASTSPTGVDVERRERDLDVPGLPARICSAREGLAVGRLVPHARRASLLDLWLAKESLTKAWGVGLAHDFRRLHLGVLDDGAVEHPGLTFTTLGNHRLCIAAPQDRAPLDQGEHR